MIIQGPDMLEQSFKIYDALELQSQEPVEKGSLGRYLFMLEMYKHTGDPHLLKNISDYLGRIEKREVSFKINNYSLFNGRAGISYSYLELFKMTREERYLHKAVEIVRDYLSLKSHPFRIHDSHGLADGTAGMLILCLFLYAETREAWLCEYIEQCISFLINKAMLTESGIYWHGVRKNIRPTGWAHGSSGIAFCLLELSAYFDNKALSSVADIALKEEDKLLEDEEGYHAGQALVRLYASILYPDTSYKESLDDYAAVLPAFLETSPEKDGSVDASNGLVDLGLAFREAYSLTQDIHYLDCANKIAAVLLDSLASGKMQPSKGRSFFAGMTYTGYFLLKLAGPDNSPSLLLPRLITSPTGDNGDLSSLRPVKINLSQRATNEQLLRRHFKATFALVEKACPDELNGFLSVCSFIYPEQFAEWVKGLSKDKFLGNEAGNLQEILEREMIVIRMRSNHRKFMLSHTMDFAAKMDMLFQLPDEDFLNLTLVVSDKIFLLKGEATIDFTKPITQDILSDLFISYGNRSYYFWGDEFTDFKGDYLGTARIFADIFVQPLPVRAVLNNIIGFLLSQDKRFVAFFIEKFTARDIDHLRERLTGVMLTLIKDMLMKCILVSA